MHFDIWKMLFFFRAINFCMEPRWIPINKICQYVFYKIHAHYSASNIFVHESLSVRVKLLNPDVIVD